MRRAALLVAALGGGLLLSACGTGTPVTENRQVGTFQRLEVEGSLDLDVRLFNRPDPGVRVTAGSKAIDRIRTEVHGDTLRITILVVALSIATVSLKERMART